MAGRSQQSAVRYSLAALLAFGALNAFAGGYYGLSGAKGVPVEWLAGSPFKNYFVPSLILFFVVGGSLLTAAIAVFARPRKARTSALVASFVLLVWIAVQMMIIGYVSWMQPTTAMGGLLALILAWQLPAPTGNEPTARLRVSKTRLRNGREDRHSRRSWTEKQDCVQVS
jgi:hypothetical protein